MPDEPRHPEFLDPDDEVAFGSFSTERCPYCDKEVTAQVLRRTITFKPECSVHGIIFPDVLVAVCAECGAGIRLVQTLMIGMGERKRPREREDRRDGEM